MATVEHLLIVAPHPDDETLGFGGALYDHLRRGGSAEVVAVTDGEAADDQASPDEQRALAGRRCAEREAALLELGAGRLPVTRFGLPDRAVTEDEHRLERALRAHLARVRRAHRACSVVLPWRHDPHPDHEATGRAGIRAATAAGVPHLEVPIWGWYQQASQPLLPRLRVRRIGISPQARLARRAALGCFSSQLESLAGGRGPVLPTDFLAAFDRPFEVVLA